MKQSLKHGGVAVLGLTAVLTLSACGSSENPAFGSGRTAPSTAKACASGADDFRALSLPSQLTPRPGPAVLYAEAPTAPQLENTGVWQAPPILISGASAYRCGEFIYQDWLFDDHGAAGAHDPTDPQEPTAFLFSPKAGTLTYPRDPVYANNAADLLEFRIKPLAGATAFRVSVNTLLDAQRLAFTIALGEDEANADWPASAGVSSPASLFLQVHGDQAQLLDAASGERLAPAPQVRIDTLRRQLEVQVPHAAWNPQRETVRVAIGVGLWDIDTGQYPQPSVQAGTHSPGGASALGAALFNLGFRSSEPLPEFNAASGRTIGDAAVLGKAQAHWWRERAQADALALGDASPFYAQVDFAKLADGVNDESGVPQHGFMNRIFASRFSFGQGVDYLSECGGVSASRPCDGTLVGQLQPYTIYVPEKPEPAEGYGLTLLLHALSANLNQYAGSRHMRDLGERGDGHIVMTPAGRGPDGFYFDVAEADTFEVWQDVARHYRLNPDRTVMGGISMGGIGSFRLAPRYPDLFARIMPVVAGASDYSELLPSLRNVPVMLWASSLDELQPLSTTEAAVGDLTDLGYRIDSYLFTTWDHLTPSTNDYYPQGDAFFGDAEVPRNPPQITYVLRPAEDEARVDVIADKAYWLSDLRLRDEALGSGRIDARSEGFGLAEPAVLTVATSQGVHSGGNMEPAPFIRRHQDWAAPAAVPPANRLHIVARNIAQVRVHTQRAQLACGAELRIDSDGPIDVVLEGC